MFEIFDISTTVLLRILYLALFAAGSVVAAFLARWLKQKADAERQRLDSELSGKQRLALDNILITAVQAAEMVGKPGSDKFLFVKGLALKAVKDLGIELTDGELNAMIESAVYELNLLAKAK